MKKRIRDFLSQNVIQGIIENTYINPIFASIFNTEEEQYETQKLYFITRSFNKKIPSSIEYILSNPEGNDIENAWFVIADMIKSKFSVKWERITRSLNFEYQPENTIHFKKDMSYGKVDSENTTDTSQYNSGTSENYSDNTNNTSSIYAFDSIEDPANTNKDLHNSSSNNVLNKTGTDTFTKNRTFNTGGIDTYTTVGRTDPYSKVFSEDIDFRNRYLLYDIIFKDIDSILTLQIY